MRIEARREMAEKRRIERLPIAAMNEHHGCRVLIMTGKDIDRVPRAIAVTQHKRRMRGAIGRRIARPPGDDRRILRHPCAVVIFDLVIDRGHRSSHSRGRGFLSGRLCLGE